MLGRFYRFCFPKIAVDIPVGSQRMAAQRRLQAGLVSAWSSRETGVAGKVTDGGVRLHIVEEGKRNSFKPWLIARFARGAGGVSLQGHFRMHPFVQGFMTLWLTGALLIIGYMTILGLSGTVEEGFPFSILFFSLGVLGFGILLLKWAWQWSAHDMGLVERYIREQTSEGE